MDFGVPHRILCDDPTAPNHVYAGSCRLLGVFCASVGLTDLPTDPLPPGANPPPTVTGMTPSSGEDGTEVVISGTGFQPQGEHSQVKIGTENAVIVAWGETEVVIAALQGQSVSAAPLAVWLRPDDKQDVMAGSFTFVPHEAATASKGKKADKAEVAAAAKKAATKKRKSVTSVAVDSHSTEVTMPEFASGAGLMIRDASGAKILVGPFELRPGEMRDLPIECRDGIEIVPSGLFDITLLLTPL